MAHLVYYSTNLEELILRYPNHLSALRIPRCRSFEPNYRFSELRLGYYR
jgi:hypothetical protein